MLCDTCIGLIRKVDKTPHLGQRKNETLEDLIRSINQGCYTCTRLRFSITDEEWEGLLSRSEGSKAQVKYLVARFKRVSTDTSVSLRLAISIYGWQYKASFHEIIPSNTSSSNTPSLAPLAAANPSVLDLARRWLENCGTTHSLCRRDQRTRSKLPDRLIDLQPSGHPRSTWQLLQTSATVIEGPYATLSHRWGPQTTVSLARLTEESMMNGLPVDSLPPVFRGAVKFAKHLGVRYLWIDNPCIPQTSFDISVQAAKMAEVFGEAEFNISTLTARQDRVFSLETAKALPHIAILDRDQYQLCRSYALDFDYIWKTEVRSAPLLRRGWIYQEQLLARRTIYFGAAQIFWECRSGRGCQMQLVLIEFGTKFDRLKTIMAQANNSSMSIYDDPDFRFDSAQNSLQLISAASYDPSAATLLKDRFSDVLSHYRLWLQLVTIYSTRELTNNNDKLLAIAGVAKIFESVVKDDYLAGCWRRQLPAQLLWRRRRGKRFDDGRSTDGRLRTGAAPSWSWASMDNEVDFFVGVYSPIHLVAQVLLADVDPTYGNPYGLIKSGRVRLRCPIVRVSLDMNNTIALAEADGALSLPSSDTILRVPRSVFDSTQDFEEICKREESSELILAIIQTRDEILTGGNQKRMIYGLLLIGTKESSKERPIDIDEHRRVGAVKIDRPWDPETGVKISCIPDDWNDVFRYPWDEDGEYLRKETSLDFDEVDYLTTLDIV